MNTMDNSTPSPLSSRLVLIDQLRGGRLVVDPYKNIRKPRDEKNNKEKKKDRKSNSPSPPPPSAWSATDDGGRRRRHHSVATAGNNNRCDTRSASGLARQNRLEMEELVSAVSGRSSRQGCERVFAGKRPPVGGKRSGPNETEQNLSKRAGFSFFANDEANASKQCGNHTKEAHKKQPTQ